MSMNLSGVEQIAEERRHQINDLGFTTQKDMAYRNGELVDAALAYAKAASTQSDECPRGWPWSENTWKPQSPIENLVRAGALIAAEIDRLQNEMENSGKN